MGLVSPFWNVCNWQRSSDSFLGKRGEGIYLFIYFCQNNQSLENLKKLKLPVEKEEPVNKRAKWIWQVLFWQTICLWVDRHSWISTSRWSNAKKRRSERLWLRGEISKQTNTCLCVCTENIVNAILPRESGEFWRFYGRRFSWMTYIWTHACITPLQDPRTISTCSAAVLQRLARIALGPTLTRIPGVPEIPLWIQCAFTCFETAC